MFPFFFLHFMVIFFRRYEILRSKTIVFAIYFTALFSYVVSLLGYTPYPAQFGLGLTFGGELFIIIWMSIFFAIGIAMVYSISGGLMEKAPGPTVMISGLMLLMLVLPGPFALSVLSNLFKESSEWYFFFSIGALISAVYIVFRYRIIGNTPYDTLKSTLAVMNDVLFKLNNDFHIMIVHGGVTPVLGYSQHALVGKSLLELIDHSDYLTQYREYVIHKKMKECYFDTTVTGSNGVARVMNLALTPMFVNEELTGFVCVGRDISERKGIENDLRKSEEKFRSLFDSVPCGIYQCNLSGTLIIANEPFARMLGYQTSDEMHGLNMDRDIYLLPRERQSVLEQLRDFKEVTNYEVVFKLKSGDLISVMENTHIVYNEKGEAQYIEGMVVDLTERKTLEEELRQSQKMESLGTLAGGVAHDFNNILQIMLSGIYNAKRQHDPVVRAKNLEMISDAVDRGANLVQQILTFAQKRDTTFISVDLNSIVRNTTAMVSSTFPKTITISTSFDDALPSIQADQTQMEQIILNLCVNARDAMPNGGRLFIGSSIVSPAEIQNRILESQRTEYIHLSVSDTGHGMDSETINRIFEPFFTTKARGKGTGLGLSVVYGIVKTHHGFVTVHSQVDKGTTFDVYLPVFSSVIENGEELSPVLSNPGNGETILVIEDEKYLLNFLTALLQEQNYNVIPSVEGYEAIEIYRTKHQQIDLVVSDIGLPNIDGWDVFLKMKEINPQIKTIVTSGHIDPVFKSKKQEEGICDFLQKPYQPREVLASIQKVLQ